MNSNERELSAIVRVEGGLADEGLLDMYDAANMIHGLARALNIVGHSFANEQDIRSRANSANGIKTLIHSSKKGCFEERIDIRFSAEVAAQLGPSVVVNNFWDYLAFSWSAAVGKSHEPQSSNLKKIVQSTDLFESEIADALESAMQDIHKPILHDRRAKIFLERPRVGDILQLNRKTLDFVATREEKVRQFPIVGNVTRYNVLSDFGRLFSNAEKRVIPFRLMNTHEAEMRALIIESMKLHVLGLPNKLQFVVSEVVTSTGFVKRYMVHSVSEIS